MGTGDGPRDIVAGDLNGNGILDLVAGGNSIGAAYIYAPLFGDGQGSFVAQSSVTGVAGTLASVALGDRNGNGSLDMVTVTRNDHVTVFLHQTP